MAPEHNISAIDQYKCDDDFRSKRHRSVRDDHEHWRHQTWNTNAVLRAADNIKGPRSRQGRHRRIVLLETRRDRQNSKRSRDDLRRPEPGRNNPCGRTPAVACAVATPNLITNALGP